MEELVRSIGVPAVVVLLVLREVKEMLARRRPGPEPSDRLHREIVTKVNELHRWHSLEDEDGIKRWYSPAHLNERMDRLERKIDTVLERKS